MTTEAIAKMDKQPTTDAAQATGIDENYVRILKGIMNDVEQIHEIDQSLDAVSREIVDELIRVLELNNRALRLENFEGREIIIHPKGFALIRDRDGDTEPRPLIDLEPPFLHAILKRLIPKLKASLDERRQSKEGLLEELTKIRDSLV